MSKKQNIVFLCGLTVMFFTIIIGYRYYYEQRILELETEMYFKTTFEYGLKEQEGVTGIGLPLNNNTISVMVENEKNKEDVEEYIERELDLRNLLGEYNLDIGVHWYINSSYDVVKTQARV